jgi:hypothetical protein
MRAKEFAAEFGIVGILDFVETEHGLVKATISLDGMAGSRHGRSRRPHLARHGLRRDRECRRQRDTTRLR